MSAPELLEATRESLALRLRAARGRISRELVADLARASDGRALLEEHLAALREKGDEAAALVACSALALLDRRGAPSWVPRSLEEAVRSGKLVEPRRQVAFEALRERGDVWARTRGTAFVDGLERLLSKDQKGVLALVAEETIHREAPKVGRNDPCPCGSGKKFKKCCEKAPSEEDGRPGLVALLKSVRWTEELYALDPEKMLALAGPEAFREHLALLSHPERPRKAPRDDPWLELAVLSRVFQSRSAPSWAKDLALDLLAKGHAALDRGGLAAWLVESFPDERSSFVDRLSGPFTPEGAAALGLALHDAGLPERALEAAAGPGGRLAFVRALAAAKLGDEARSREELDLLVEALEGSDAAVLRAAALEARAGLEDPGKAPEPEPEPSPVAAPAPVPAPVKAAEPEPTEPVIGPRAAPLVDAELPREISELAGRREQARATQDAELARARREHEEARAAQRAAERELEKARERADHAKRAVTRAEHELARAEKDGPRVELAAIQRALEEGHARIAEALRASWKRGVEVAVPVVAALAPDAMALCIPIPAKEYLEGALDPSLSLIAHATVAQVATVARQGEQGEETVVPASLMGFLAVRGKAPLARYRERNELWALALDEAWATLELPGSPRLAPVLAPLPELAGKTALELAKPLEARALARPRGEEKDRFSIEEAAGRLGLSPFALARALGARALWESTGTVLEGTLETLRLLDPRAPARPEKHEAESSEHELAPDDPIAEDPDPARRALRTVLRRLVRFGKIGGSHTRVDNALRGAPPHLRGTIKRAVDALCTLGVFRAKPTLNGIHISIEPVRLREIDIFVATAECPWPKVRAILEGH